MNALLKMNNSKKQNAYMSTVRKNIEALARSKISNARKGQAVRTALRPKGAFTYVQNAAASNHFKKYKDPRRMKSANNQTYYNNKGNEEFKYYRGQPDTIHRNIVTMNFPLRNKVIWITDGKNTQGKNKQRMYNINTLEKWILASKKAQTPMRYAIQDKNKNAIIRKVTNKNAVRRILKPFRPYEGPDPFAALSSSPTNVPNLRYEDLRYEVPNLRFAQALFAPRAPPPRAPPRWSVSSGLDVSGYTRPARRSNTWPHSRIQRNLM